MKQIPEDILMTITAEVLGIEKFDGGVFSERIADINIPENNVIVFVFHDGTKVRHEWKNKPRGKNPKYDGRRDNDAECTSDSCEEA